MKKRILVWFKQDLRLRDNEMLTQAIADAEEIIPFYCFDAHYEQELNIGQPKTGKIRKQFLHQSLADLDASLQEKGSALWFCKGNTAQEIRQVHERFPLDAIYFSEEATYDELQLVSQVEALGIECKLFWQSTLYHKQNLPFELSKMPFVFTPFRKKLEKYSEIREEVEVPKKITSPEREANYQLPTLADVGWEEVDFPEQVVLPFVGGEREAWKRLEHYFWETDCLASYKETRNGLVGPDYSSKFSAWLANGSISAVSIYHQIKAYEEERTANQSTYWLIFELIWRDFFRFTALKEGHTFFRYQRNEKMETTQAFEKWRLGNTGVDFVDANMQELLETGFMSNRGRQNVASFLVNDLKQDWRLGAAWFESQLIDYDVCSNYGNWTYVAGVGHDPRKDRYFNIEKQANQYDPNGEFIRTWLVK